MSPVSAAARDAARHAAILPYLPGLERRGRSNGGEWRGPCPRCGGTDRLVAWPDHPRGGRAWCRQCHPAPMDAIALVQWLGRAAGYAQAVDLLAGDFPNPPAPFPRGEGGGRRPSPARGGAAGEDGPRPYRPPRAGQRVVARYTYYKPNSLTFSLEEWAADEAGCQARRAAAWAAPRLLYQKERREPGRDGRAKEFLCRRPRPGLAAPRADCPDDWLFGAGTDERWPYNWPAAWALPAGVPLLWVDGEKDVETARACGLTAVCGPDGGGSWRPDWSALFMDHPALLIADGTPEGLAQAEHTARLLDVFPDWIRIRRLPAKDFTALLDAAPHAKGDPYDVR